MSDRASSDDAASEDPFELGRRVRREVLGDEHVERSLAQASDFSRPMQEFVTEYCWGQSGRDPGSEPRERSLSTSGC